MDQIRKGARFAIRNQQWIFAGGIFVVGVIVAFLTHRVGFGVGDHSTFFIFGKSIAEGEVIYKDFIHFRMPGSFFLMALSMLLFGVEQASSMLEIALESHVGYPLLLLASGMLLTSRHRWVVAVLAAMTVLWPPILQLRSGLGMLAVVLYASAGNSGRRLGLSGAIGALTVIFGQELGVLSFAIIVGLECTQTLPDWKRLRRRLSSIAVGALVVALPFFAYMAIFSNLGDFLYYTLYYAFFVQPSGMDLAFPIFRYSYLIYYMPFIAYAVSFVLFGLSRRITAREAGLLAFAYLRLLTLLGRSDMSHLIFSTPELALIVWLAIQSLLKGLDLSPARLKQIGGLTFALVLVSVLATQYEGKLIVLCLPIFMLALWLDRTPEKSSGLKLNIGPMAMMFAGSAMAIVVLFLYMIFPQNIATAKLIRRGWQLRNEAPRISGLHPIGPSEKLAREAEQITRFIQDEDAQTLFSFPIQPYYYTLVDHHSSVFLSFELQTTHEEQQRAIRELEMNPPDVVVFDVGQAQGLSGSIPDITDYITSNFDTAQEFTEVNYIRTMTPRAQPSLRHHLLYRLYQVADNQGRAFGHHDPKEGVYDAIRHIGGEPILFSAQISENTSLHIGLDRDFTDASGQRVCGVVTIRLDGTSSDTIVCSDQDRLEIPLKGSQGSMLEVSLVLQDGIDSAIWLDPVIQADL